MTSMYSSVQSNLDNQTSSIIENRILAKTGFRYPDSAKLDRFINKGQNGLA
jgi:hypothetical protein